MNVTLPPLRTLFPATSLPSPSPSPTEYVPMMVPETQVKAKHEPLYSLARPPFPLSTPSHAYHDRRISTGSIDSESSAPALIHSPSPSPSPPPSPHLSPQPFLLVPCDLNVADAVVVVSSSTSPSAPSPVLRYCKPSEAKATLLIGPAISAHARKNRGRRMHPYRIVRERQE